MAVTYKKLFHLLIERICLALDYKVDDILEFNQQKQ